ncbi:NUDIX hydrolase [Undibacterium sp. Di24W]|uniref:NUDIX hydrolase n=1 Tax=Undibacterium sp. Di24W TaxID=3413033 RepID=UPI003BF29FD8
MKFCSACAAPVTLKIPADDTRERFVCTKCGTVHYQNPNMVVGTLPVWDIAGEAKVLLCKRAIEPRYGYWTLPAGFMENQETCRQAAQRETIEEAGANIELHELFSVLSVPHVDQVHLFYRATLVDTNYLAGVESLEVTLFAEHEIPWDEIAFATVSQTLKFFFEDLKKVQHEGQFSLHEHDFYKSHHPE